jgi:hypothetical protein
LEFAHQGGKVFAKENSGKSPVIVKFDEKPNEETRAKMRNLGHKWNAIRGEWRRYGNLKVPKDLLKNEEV